MSSTDPTASIRPTKKQRELLSYIEKFISEHGYSPSYREIMNGLNYTSVATVALHVNSLIRRGHLRKRDRSARSLEVVALPDTASRPAAHNTSDESWLLDRVEQIFTNAEAAGNETSVTVVSELTMLVGALKVLQLHAAAERFEPRLQALAEKSAEGMAV